ncbi:LacI family DNA-binding transcriptional regulator [Bounagaea algeriensis]
MRRSETMCTAVDGASAAVRSADQEVDDEPHGDGGGAQRQVTIYDVARHCGVAASTVSRAFSRPGRVSARMRERVYTAARVLGYVPPERTRAAAGVRERAVMLVVSDIANPYYGPLVKAAQSHAFERGYTLALADSDESPQLEASNAKRLLAASAGAILATSRLSDDVVESLARTVPLVMLNRASTRVPTLIWDTAGGMHEAVQHLAELGHRRITYLAGPRNSWMNSQRWRAVRAASAQLGMRTALLGPCTPTLDAGYEAGAELADVAATAVIAYNDLVALGATRRLLAAGVRVPEEVSVVGCDDIFGANLTAPGLTTLRGPAAEMGASAVDVLQEWSSSRAAQPRCLTFAAELVVRGSTGCAPDRGN